MAAATAIAWVGDSPVAARAGGVVPPGGAAAFLGLLAAAFAVYLGGLLALRRRASRLAAVAAVAAAVQLAPLAAPLLLSTDAWTYWDYGRIAAVHGGDPYVDHPSAYPDDPAFAQMGARWHERTTAYGPAFTLASEPLALAAGRSSSAAAWIFKGLAAASALAAAAAVAAVARRKALALAFVGWNPVLAVHLAGGGHNDAWVGALALAAIALAARGRRQLAGGAWVLAAAVKWVPLLFLALHVLATRRSRSSPGLVGGLAAACAVGGLATWRYGLDWLSALGPLTENAQFETRYALPHRLQSVGVPRGVAVGLAVAVLVAVLLWIGRDALRGRRRVGLAACAVLATTPYLAVWYLGWAVPLAAVDEDDRLAHACALALCAYLLPQTIPR